MLRLYDLAHLPQGGFADTTNVLLQHVDLNNTSDLEEQNAENSISPMPKNASRGQGSPEDEIVNITGNSTPESGRRNSANWHNITLTPSQFTEISSKKLVNSDETGFVMIQTISSSPSKHEQSDDTVTMTEQSAKEMDHEIFKLRGLRALWHFVFAWSLTVVFFFYFLLIFYMYILILNQFSSKHWFYMAVVHSYLNVLTRTVNGKVVYYLTYYQSPMYESSFNKWLSLKLFVIFLTEYTKFFYTASYGEFHFSNPEKLKDAPTGVRPCREGMTFLSFHDELFF